MKPRIIIQLLFCLILPAIAAMGGVPDKATNVNPVEVGSDAPDPEVRTPSGEKVRLSEVTGGEPVALVFYRGGWCPYCSRQLEGLAGIEEELNALGYEIIALSADSPEKVREAVEESPHGYRLLSDAGMQAAKAFGLAFKVDKEGYDRLVGFGINLEEASGKDHHLLPVPAVFLVDKKGTIRFRYFNPDYSVRISPEELLKAAKAK